jgi:hypothetical protein
MTSLICLFQKMNLAALNTTNVPSGNRRTIGTHPLKRQTSQSGYSPFGRDCDVTANEVHAPTNPELGFSSPETSKRAHKVDSFLLRPRRDSNPRPTA